MRISGVVCLTAALALSCFARADGIAPTASALGMTEVLLNYCAKVDPSAVARYQQQAKLLTQGLSDDALDKLRSSDEYRQASDSTEDALRDSDQKQAKRTCSDSLAQAK